MASLKYYNKNTNQWEYVSAGYDSGSSDILIDNTLTKAGQAADAKAVGDALAEKQPKGNYLTSIPSEYVTESELNAKNYLTNFNETDPTVPAWAKQPTKPSYTANEVGALPASTVIPTVPTNVSAFTNDAGFLTEAEVVSLIQTYIPASGDEVSY